MSLYLAQTLLRQRELCPVCISIYAINLLLFLQLPRHKRKQE